MSFLGRNFQYGLQYKYNVMVMFRKQSNERKRERERGKGGGGGGENVEHSILPEVIHFDAQRHENKCKSMLNTRICVRVRVCVCVG